MESLYFWFMTGKSSWVPFCTQALFLTCCRWYSLSWLLQELLLSSCGRGVRPQARPLCVVLPMMFLSDLIMNWHVFEPCMWWWFQNYIASATAVELVVIFIFIFELRCTMNYLWTLCNMWRVCWIMYDLGCILMVNRDPSWYSTDYRVYMDSSTIVRPLVGFHCTCALINWSVLLHV